MMQETIAFYGAGMLGSGFVTALQRAGHRVQVWNRSFEKAAALEGVGAHAFRDAIEAATGAGRVHLCVRDDDAVDAVLAAALPGIGPGVLIVDHTTVLPHGVAARTARLAAAGHPFIHAPVFMGPQNACDASGTMLASGASTTFDLARPALEPMTGDLRYLGERADAAAIYKLMGNAMMLAVIGGLNDVFTLGDAGGLSPEQAFELFSFYSPQGQITGRGKRMARGDYEPTWTLDMARKDASLMLASAPGAELPVIRAVEAALAAAIARGYGGLDAGAIAKR
ncbi:MAG: NAD(P)-dependent oxidoreductase [Vulcanimicrobiaceae bacterium]